MKSGLKINWRRTRRVVIKIGSNVISDEHGPRPEFFRSLRNEIKILLQANCWPIIVTSGAVSTGMALSKMKNKPQAIPAKQALAAIGQPHLMQLYIKAFAALKASVAQILITQPNLEDRTQFLNARHALEELFARKIIPVINENDTVVVDEMKVGDNDQLSAHIANLVRADLLIILSDVDGLFDSDPRKNNSAKLIEEIHTIDDKILALASGAGSERSTGGMITKLKAARIGNEFGIPVIITNGLKKNFIKNLIKGPFCGTIFWPKNDALNARKHWIGNVIKPKGKIIVDAGARHALSQQGRSLLPSGIKDISGHFEMGDCIEIWSESLLFAKGLTSYSSDECLKIKGCKTTDIEKILGYRGADEVIHRDDMVLMRED